MGPKISNLMSMLTVVVEVHQLLRWSYSSGKKVLIDKNEPK